MIQSIQCPHCQTEIPINEFLDQAIHESLNKEHHRILQEAQKNVEAELSDLNDQLRLSREKLGQAQEQEMLLRKERRQLENKAREMECILQRQLDEERQKILEESKRQADEEHRLKEADHAKLISDLRNQINEMKRKAELGIPSIQGEVAELDLEDFLRCQFPQDEIESVPVGVHGGDLIQRVRDFHGQLCGLILWESKRTKSWNESWLGKLRQDQMEAKADFAVLLTAEAPKGLNTFSLIDGIWVTKRSCLEGLAIALRTSLIEIARTHRSLDQQSLKSDRLIQYFWSPIFRLKIDTLVQTYQSLKEDLNSEKRAHHRLWAKREKQLEQAMTTLSGFVGDLDGIMDSSVPAFEQLTSAMIELETDSPIESIFQETSPF